LRNVSPGWYEEIVVAALRATQMTIGRQNFRIRQSIKRAEHLAAEYSLRREAAEIYERIARFQKNCFSTLVKERTKKQFAHERHLRHGIESDGFVAEIPELLALVEGRLRHLECRCKELSRDGSASWIALLSELG